MEHSLSLKASCGPGGIRSAPACFGRCAVLARFGFYEVRLTEFPPDCMPSLPLWVELYRDGGRVDGCGFSEIEDAVDAVREFVAQAKRLHEGS